MPQLNGLDAARKLKEITPGIKLIFITMNPDPFLVREAFRAGASAFLLKQEACSGLPAAIEQVLKGGTYVSPQTAEGQTNISLREPKDREHASEPTARQREVIQLLAEGLSMKQVADALKITKYTVALHKYTVMQKLQIKSSAELVQYAIKHNIISV
jgi:DNA-binding NarL/FixJ family response regulator